MKLNYKRTFFIGLAFLSISAFWQLYDNIIPLILQNTFHIKETVTGTLMAMDNIFALFLLPVFGTLSDKVNTKFGKRMPFIVSGTIFAFVLMMILPIAARNNSLLLFICALFGTLLAMGLYRSPSVALMPDLTPAPQRSKANAVINLMGAVGGVYALLMIKVLLGKNETPDYFMLFLAVGGLMVVSVLVLVITIPENRLRKEILEHRSSDNASCDNSEIRMESDDEGGKSSKMSPDVRKSFVFLLASIFLWYFAYNAVTTAFSRYTKVVWKMEGGGFANCLMVATIAAILSYIPIGFLAGKIGRKKTILSGIVLMSACYLFAVFCSTYHPTIQVAFALIGVGWAAINVNSYPMIVEMATGNDIGKYTGTYYTFSMAAQILTPILSGFMLEHVSYRTLFPYAFVFSTLAFFTMCMVRHGDCRPEDKKSILENFDVDD